MKSLTVIKKSAQGSRQKSFFLYSGPTTKALNPPRGQWSSFSSEFFSSFKKSYCPATTDCINYFVRLSVVVSLLASNSEMQNCIENPMLFFNFLKYIYYVSTACFAVSAFCLLLTGCISIHLYICAVSEQFVSDSVQVFKLLMARVR